jgi:hypothetical protein
MRILLAAKYVPTGSRPIGGVQSWIATVRAELERMGNNIVEEWQPGFPMPTGGFDLGIFANMGLTGHLAALCKRTVCVSHGIIEPERPGEADRVLFVSEGVRGHWGGNGAIIRQPIDAAFWRPTVAQRRGVVRYSYRGSPTQCAIIAEALEMPYRHIMDATPGDARDILAGAALVFASGRAALEAMACGAPTVIYDHRQAYQGPLMDDDLHRQMRNSYSGRCGIDPTLNDLLGAAGRAMEAGSRREWVEKYHDAREIVEELIT